MPFSVLAFGALTAVLGGPCSADPFQGRVLTADGQPIEAAIIRFVKGSVPVGPVPVGPVPGTRLPVSFVPTDRVRFSARFSRFRSATAPAPGWRVTTSPRLSSQDGLRRTLTLERNLVAERTASVLAHKKQQGRVYNHTPYGFERVEDRLVVAVEEMDRVRLMQERREDGWSFGMIADAFNGDNVPGKSGGKWYGRNVKDILENSLYRNVA